MKVSAHYAASGAYLVRLVGTREIRRIKQRIEQLRQLLDDEVGIPRTTAHVQ